ncbi:TlpA disulfide reductase family protein [uncultured Winogradskyella sp.]|uniref:TlpA family protein disulfide reductase n=1 Tax=uncultured Winogradskyella sp. TaxID=395353 RepID=UPI0030DAFC88|tara:strand:- start:2674 stop:3396 length:723 start_codon:yes stop_codon:yes gene_type:complete
MKKTTSTLILIILTFISCSQKDKLFYKDSFNGIIYTESEYIEYKQTKSSELQNKNSSLKEYIIEQYKSKDSTINLFKLNTITKSRVTTQKTNQEKIYSLIGKEFPKVKLKHLDGKYYDLGINNNKPTFINIWYTNCKPCVAEIDFLNEIKKEYQDKINFVAITFESKNVVDKFLKKKQFDFIQIVESKNFLHELGIKLYPKSIFINSSNIVDEVKGALILNQEKTESHKIEFKKYLEKLL